MSRLLSRNFSMKLTVAVAFVLLVQVLANVSMSRAAQSASSDWVSNGNWPFNMNYSPQTQITPQNAQFLTPQWIFPIPSAPPPFQGFNQEGVVATPLIVGGVAYFVTNWNRLYAVSAATGGVIWFKDVNIRNITSSSFYCFRVQLGCGIIVNTHIHNGQFLYTSSILGQPLVWFSTAAYQIFAFNALTGDIARNFTWFNPSQKVAGSFGVWDPLSANMIAIDEKRGILVVGTQNTDCQCEARGFIDGWNINVNPPTHMWGPTFIMPPQDGSDPNWSINSVGNMTHAYIFNGTGAVDLKALPASTLHSVLYNDWGNTGFNGTRSYAGLGINWGGPWGVNQQAGIVYVSTSQASPDANATFRPGPDLWSASILAVNDQTGQYVWGFQTTPHDLVDWDCSWGTILANVTINGAPQLELMKGCKNGYVYGLNAATGAMNWYYLPASERRHFATILNPLSTQNMTKPWKNYPSKGFVFFNCPATGCIESDPAYDPNLNLLFVAAYNDPANGTVTAVGPKAVYAATGAGIAATAGTTFPQFTNTTVWAINGATGKPVWSYFLGNFGYRGGVTESNGVVFMSTPAGAMQLINAQTGKLIQSIFIGASQVIQPAIGTDSNGNVKVIVPAASSSPGNFGGIVVTPGFVLAMGLSQAAATSTATTTSVSTVVSTATSTVAASTVTSTIGASTVTQTSTVQAGTTGINSTTFYAVAGVAVIFVIVSAVLALRGRKPTP